MATRNCNTLTAKQKADLCFWLREHANAAQTYRVLAELATLELGFAVTESNVQGWWVAVNGPRKAAKVGFAALLDALDARVQKLEAGQAEFQDWADKIEEHQAALGKSFANIERRITP
jgi:hypothetical protein